MNGITRRTVSTVVILTIFILLFFYKLNNKKSNPLLSKKQNLDSKRKNPDTNSNNNKYAYASLLCDDVMIDATKVLIHSLKKTKTPYPFILLILPEVKQTEDLIRLGAELHSISPLDYPFKVNNEKIAINKMCRYSKLHIWKFIQYKKIIFIDIDTLITQNLDSAFEYPEFSAVRDAGDTFNTGLFVLQPSLVTWKRMLSIYFSSPSYNQGDQGFLNWYFRNSTKQALPFKYNTVCKHKSNAMWALMKRQAKMVHYTSETKPWTFFMGTHKFWKQNWEMGMFYLWARAFRIVTRELEIDVHDFMRRGTWYNANRAIDICERAHGYIENSQNNNPSVKHNNKKMIVVIFKWKNIYSLEDTIYYYRKVATHLVEKIYIYWSPKSGLLPPELTKYRFLKDQPLIEIVRHRYESPNNLWNPIHTSPQTPILFVDDDNFPEVDKLEVAREVWKNNPFALVGFFPRYHHKQQLIIQQAQLEEEVNGLINDNNNALENKNDTKSNLIDLTNNNNGTKISTNPIFINAYDERYKWTFNLTSLRRPRPYTLISPSLLLLNSDYLFTYTCLLPERIHRFVDDHSEEVEFGGADLAMNLLAQGMTGQRAIAIKNNYPDPEKIWFNNIEGANNLSNGGNYAVNKGRVLQELVKFFSSGKDLLTANSLIVGQYNKIPFKKKSMKRWNDAT